MSAPLTVPAGGVRPASRSRSPPSAAEREWDRFVARPCRTRAAITCGAGGACSRARSATRRSTWRRARTAGSSACCRSSSSAAGCSAGSRCRCRSSNYGGVCAERRRRRAARWSTRRARRRPPTRASVARRAAAHAAAAAAICPAREHKVGMRLPLERDAARAWDGARSQGPQPGPQGREERADVARSGGVELLDAVLRGVRAATCATSARRSTRARSSSSVLSTLPATRHACSSSTTATHGRAARSRSSHRDALEVPWASSLREYRAQCPNNLLYWRIIEHAIDAGMTDARLRPLDAGRGHVSVQGAVGRAAEAARTGNTS